MEPDAGPVLEQVSCRRTATEFHPSVYPVSCFFFSNSSTSPSDRKRHIYVTFARIRTHSVAVDGAGCQGKSNGFLHRRDLLQAPKYELRVVDDGLSEKVELSVKLPGEICSCLADARAASHAASHTTVTVEAAVRACWAQQTQLSSYSSLSSTTSFQYPVCCHHAYANDPELPNMIRAAVHLYGMC